MKNLLIVLLLSHLFCFSQLEKVNKESLQSKNGIDMVKVKPALLKIDSIKKNSSNNIRETEQINCKLPLIRTA